eukprot:6195068-Pleurochrysis_carterae.AAC.5
MRPIALHLMEGTCKAHGMKRLLQPGMIGIAIPITPSASSTNHIHSNFLRRYRIFRHVRGASRICRSPQLGQRTLLNWKA